MRRVSLMLMFASALLCLAGCGTISFQQPNPPAAQAQVAFLQASPAPGAVQNAAALPAGNTKVMMMNTDGTGQAQFGPSSDYGAVDVSHDGTKAVALAYDSDLGNLQLAVVTSNGAQVITPAGVTPQFPEFSPDGSKIYFINIGGENGYEIWAINPDGSGATNLGHVDYCMHQVTVAPDGKIYFYGHSEAGYGIYSMNADGTNPTMVIDDDAAEHPAVTADGSKLIYERDAEGYDIYSANMDGSNPVALTTGGNSEDPIVVGDKILFVSTRDGNEEIYSMDLNGSNQTRLTNNTVADIFGDWYTPW